MKLILTTTATLAAFLFAQAKANDVSSRSVRGGLGGRSSSDPRDLQMTGTLTGLDLINANTGQIITKLSSNQVIVLSQIPGMTTPALNIEATFTGNGIDSVVFNYGASPYRTDRGAPYALCSNSGRTFSVCSVLGIATHTVTATPYSSNATGTVVAGTPLSVTFTIVAAPPAPVSAPVAAPVAPPVKAHVAIPTKAPLLAPVPAPVLAPLSAPVSAPVTAPFLAPVSPPMAAPPGVPQCAVPRVNIGWNSVSHFSCRVSHSLHDSSVERDGRIACRIHSTWQSRTET
jgi:hypothetical protein